MPWLEHMKRLAYLPFHFQEYKNQIQQQQDRTSHMIQMEIMLQLRLLARTSNLTRLENLSGEEGKHSGPKEEEKPKDKTSKSMYT